MLSGTKGAAMSMAENVSRAARQPVYEVRERREGDARADLAVHFETGDFALAVEFAFDFLEANDPLRAGAVEALEIVRVLDGTREPVWEYSHARAAAAPVDLIDLWGFDVTRSWQGPPPHRPAA
jgi:hypothetical protein